MPLFRLKLTWLFALFSLLLAAPSYGEHPEAPMSAGSWLDSVPVFVDRTPVRPVPSGTVSAELLRYPVSGKALRMLQRALRSSDAGNHFGAVDQLQKTLVRYPQTGAYVYSLLGVEYLRTEQIADAVDALERAVTLLPHDASNHANLGLALVSRGQYDRAEPELRRALDLDPHYALASQLLGVLAVSKNAPK